MSWRPLFLLAAAACAAPFGPGFGGVAQAKEAYRLSGPVAHENLAIYFLYSTSTGQTVPLTLQEALAKGTVTVHETGNVNELLVENAGAEEVFVQAGDIVKGGKQDRVLTVSLLLPPRSGRMPIGAFCVEQGRWTARGSENVARFASSAQSMPSRDAKIAMFAPVAPSTTGSAGDVTAQRALQGSRSETGVRQSGVWESVASAQRKLSSNLGADIAASQSASSLQLSLENKKLAEVRAAYIAALSPAGETESDIVGCVFAINGQVNSAEVYSSNGLFRKMWPKLLQASATEAISERNGQAQTAPTTQSVQEFLANAERGRADERKLNERLVRASRETEKSYMFETKRIIGGAMVHRSYLAH